MNTQKEEEREQEVREILKAHDGLTLEDFSKEKREKARKYPTAYSEAFFLLTGRSVE